MKSLKKNLKMKSLKKQYGGWKWLNDFIEWLKRTFRIGLTKKKEDELKQVISTNPKLVPKIVEELEISNSPKETLNGIITLAHSDAFSMNNPELVTEIVGELQNNNSPKEALNGIIPSNFLMNTTSNKATKNEAKRLNRETVAWLNKIQTTWSGNKDSPFLFNYTLDNNEKKSKKLDKIKNITFLGADGIKDVYIQIDHDLRRYPDDYKIIYGEITPRDPDKFEKTEASKILDPKLLPFIDEKCKERANLISENTIKSLSNIITTWKDSPQIKKWYFKYERNGPRRSYINAHYNSIKNIYIDKVNDDGTITLVILDEKYKDYNNNFITGEILPDSDEYW